MAHTRLSLIVAHDARRGIGYQGTIPWHLSADLIRFKALTTGHPVIMGRKTYESIGRPLPGRTNIVISRNPNFDANGCEIVASLEDALRKTNAVDMQECFVIGGAEIYRLALPLADRLYLTVVAGEYEADTFFPEYESQFTRLVSREAAEENGVRFVYEIRER